MSINQISKKIKFFGVNALTKFLELLYYIVRSAKSTILSLLKSDVKKISFAKFLELLYINNTSQN